MQTTRRTSWACKGITNAVEDVIVARDILLAKETGVRLHLCHCSTADSARMLAIAKADGLPVTGEVCPHHFILSTDDITGDDGNFKMNPPLRSRADVEALAGGAEDRCGGRHRHGPRAPRGGGEEPLHEAGGPSGDRGDWRHPRPSLTRSWWRRGCSPPMQMAAKMSCNPARILGLSDRGSRIRRQDRGCDDL